MIKKAFFISLAIFLVAPILWGGVLLAATPKVSPTPSVEPTPTETPTPIPVVRTDLTQKTVETVGPLEKLLSEQNIGPILPFNLLKYAIKHSVEAGVPPNTIVLLLLLPAVASVIAGTRHLVGVRGFGIFLPAALSVVFLATGPIVGIILFLIIVLVSTVTRLLLRKLKFKLQYLPRMALILWMVSLSVLLFLFLAPFINYPGLTNVSIFAVLILALLTEDFIRVQLGKSAKTAISLTSETVILSLVSYVFLTLRPVQEWALLNPEWFLTSILIFNLILGKYSGLRLMEIWRFRKLILN
jgi:hypothetical protein